MKPLRLEVANSAWTTLDELTTYWSKVHSHDLALELVNELFREANWLCRHPRAGAFEPWMRYRRFKYRRWIVGHVKIVYRVTRGSIRIVDFFDSRQDPNKMKG